MSSGNFTGIVGPENFVVEQRAAGRSVGKLEVHRLRLAIFSAPAHSEDAVFQKTDKAASETQKVRCAQGKPQQEFVEMSDGAQFGGDIQQLVEFVGLSPSSVTKLGIGNGHRPEP